MSENEIKKGSDGLRRAREIDTSMLVADVPGKDARASGFARVVGIVRRGGRTTFDLADGRRVGPVDDWDFVVSAQAKETGR